MKRLVILGGGMAGTTVANKLRAAVPADQLHITVVDLDDTHMYQPGFVFVPFGMLRPSDTYNSRHSFIDDGIELVLCEIDRVDPQARAVHLNDGRSLPYDHLIVATGVTTTTFAPPRPRAAIRSPSRRPTNCTGRRKKALSSAHGRRLRESRSAMSSGGIGSSPGRRRLSATGRYRIVVRATTGAYSTCCGSAVVSIAA